MPFYDEKHKNKINELEPLWENLKALNSLANKYGISDIFQDNGAKVLQQIIYLNMAFLPGREGNDSISENNLEWELKSINLSTKATGFSTNHHTNLDIINKYRNVYWAFSIYEDINLKEIYVMNPEKLEVFFQKWEEQLKEKSHLNNPKIPVSFVRSNGIQVYPINVENPISPESCQIK